MIRVELDMFSGRENPAWALDAAESSRFVEVLRNLEPTAYVQTDAGLGYRGFRTTGVPGFDAVVVRRDIVQLRRHNRVETLHDSGHCLEALLLTSAKARIDSDLYELVAGWIRNGPTTN